MLLLLVAIVTAAACVMHNNKLKRNGSNSTANVHDNYNSKTSAEQGKETNIYNKDTNTNAVYNKQTGSANTELEVLYDTVGPVQGNIELQQSTEHEVCKLNVEQNVAYESSTAAKTSLRSNVAYNTHKFGTPFQEN